MLELHNQIPIQLFRYHPPRYFHLLFSFVLVPPNQTSCWHIVGKSTIENYMF
ncbi:hypothetical protein GLOIN_2v1638781 [Rhizophagus irregularis DAOM 181602=DAOM 197198]|uniref:Uncharacterized protein n=1 Tax=Rhizophagus irregularis (strain DAOM 181602 / DAOM 197198 / MUCL 43194) TaxID=747089 RepID=A0A2P4PSF2_RHIID|nr:hypothetical protein GLOIN_2v1638781 [Rhizophagus irregularis DAOM 181602=DAOM 197198]POG68313.1 hypothetical protein GLOIN_2v1638781 [Rhizophagus irregularis DAOM 181602=DAOM 197198]|eukprot:XP_025175179.1 hypothetical protein GLOIN_2v1638781 [Rhizophagus irregularis DAOM 181602=DAOM 197198]